MAEYCIYLGHMDYVLDMSVTGLKKQFALLRRAWEGVVKISCKEDRAMKTLNVVFTAVQNEQ